jgi:hypothetical protein
MGKPRGKGKPFGPANPPPASEGRPPMPPEIREARKMNQNEVARLINRLINLSEAEVQAIQDDKTAPMLDRMIAGIVLVASLKADFFRLNFLFDRGVGRVTEKIKIERPKPTVIKYKDGSTVVLGHTPEDEE